MLPPYLKISKKNLKCSKCKCELDREKLFLCDACFAFGDDRTYFCEECLKVIIYDKDYDETLILCHKHRIHIKKCDKSVYSEKNIIKKTECISCNLPIHDYCRVPNKPWICNCCYLKK